MAIKVIYDTYSEVCGSYSYGKEFLDLPLSIIDRLDEVMDGTEFGAYDGPNPDNLWVNSYTTISGFELVEHIEIDEDELGELIKNNQLDEYITEHYDEIYQQLSNDYTVLGYADGEWHVLA